VVVGAGVVVVVVGIGVVEVVVGIGVVEVVGAGVVEVVGGGASVVVGAPPQSAEQTLSQHSSPLEQSASVLQSEHWQSVDGSQVWSPGQLRASQVSWQFMHCTLSAQSHTGPTGIVYLQSNCSLPSGQSLGLMLQAAHCIRQGPSGLHVQ